MLTYVDTSVVLRLTLHEPGHLAGWQALQAPFTSELTRVEALRTLDRRRVQGGLSPVQLADRRAFVLNLLDALAEVEVSRAVLARAAEAFPTPLRTLDAIHLATVVLASRSASSSPRLTVATHDLEFAVAARALGHSAVGC